MRSKSCVNPVHSRVLVHITCMRSSKGLDRHVSFSYTEKHGEINLDLPQKDFLEFLGCPYTQGYTLAYHAICTKLQCMPSGGSPMHVLNMTRPGNIPG